MRVLMCGSRDWTDREKIVRVIDNLCGVYGQDIAIIHGGCRGADTIAGEEASAVHLAVYEYKADWETHGKKAGPIRNQHMLDHGRPHLCIAFHHDYKRSKGTKDMVTRCVEAGVPVIVIT